MIGKRSKANKLKRAGGIVALGLSFFGAQAATLYPELAKVLTDQEVLEQVTETQEEEVLEGIKDCQNGAYEQALPKLEKHAATGNVLAGFMLAKLYLHGAGVEADLPRALSLLEANAEKRHGLSILGIAEIKEDAGEFDEALIYYQRAATINVAGAHLKLGDVFERGGLGVKKNPKLAVSHYRRLAEAGNAAGCLRLARCYDAGVGVSVDALIATRWLRKAAIAGIGDAQVMMARRYFAGRGVDADPAAALGWLTLGARSGSAEAMVLLGRRNQLGDLLPQDFNRAGQLYSNAAKLGDPTGRYYLGLMYRDGLGVKVDRVRAYVLLQGAQALPDAKSDFEALRRQLSKEELKLAEEKMAELDQKE